MAGRRAVAGLAACLLAAAPALVPPAMANVPVWGTNGFVYAIASRGHDLYIGGGFDYVGPTTGSVVPLSRATGRPVANFPQVDGAVDAIVGDGAGGYYIGGDFTTVGGVPRHDLAHVTADGGVDPAWHPATDNRVAALAVAGPTIYVGGSFATIDGQARSCIAALDARSGAVTTWAPGPCDVAGSTLVDDGVKALAVSGTSVLAGGQFGRLGGTPRRNLAALDARTGAVTPWNPRPDGTITALLVSGAQVYVSGPFSHVGGRARSSVAALNLGSGIATAWHPRVAGNLGVSALALAGRTLYVGGDFKSVDGRRRNGLAAVDARSGAATAWDPRATGAENFDINALAVAGRTIYVGGAFSRIGGRIRHDFAALGARSGSARRWRANAGDFVEALAISGSKVIVGGDFMSVGGVPRASLASLDMRTGRATSWNPGVGGPESVVKALAATRRRIYVGGSFRRIGRRTRWNIAAVDARSARPTGWNPDSDDEVDALAVSGGSVFAGGRFDTIGRRARPLLARLSAASGVARRWNARGYGVPCNDVDPCLDPAVESLLLSGHRLYVGGAFTRMGRRERTGLAALDTRSAVATAWNPDASAGGTPDEGDVAALALSGRRLYAGGTFTQIGRHIRVGIAAFDTRSGRLAPWNPGTDEVNGVLALAVRGPTVYAGGSFDSIGGRDFENLAALDARTGRALDWDPEPGFTVNAFALRPCLVVAGGEFPGGLAGLEAPGCH